MMACDSERPTAPITRDAPAASHDLETAFHTMLRVEAALRARIATLNHEFGKVLAYPGRE